MAHSDALPIVEDLLHKFAYRLMDSDERVTGLMSETNSVEWNLCDPEDLKARFKGKGLISFSVKLNLSGEPAEDRPFSGSRICVDVEGEAATPQSSNEWEIQSYEIRSAEITDF